MKELIELVEKEEVKKPSHHGRGKGKHNKGTRKAVATAGTEEEKTKDLALPDASSPVCGTEGEGQLSLLEVIVESPGAKKADQPVAKDPEKKEIRSEAVGKAIEEAEVGREEAEVKKEEAEVKKEEAEVKKEEESKREEKAEEAGSQPPPPLTETPKTAPPIPAPASESKPETTAATTRTDSEMQTEPAPETKPVERQVRDLQKELDDAKHMARDLIVFSAFVTSMIETIQRAGTRTAHDAGEPAAGGD